MYDGVTNTRSTEHVNHLQATFHLLVTRVLTCIPLEYLDIALDEPSAMFISFEIMGLMWTPQPARACQPCPFPFYKRHLVLGIFSTK